MKCLYWNVRGLANSPTKLALKKLILDNKPVLCFVYEPWISVDRISISWLNRVGMKIIAVNNRGSLLPNLWCLCSIHLNPVILAINDQLISISLNVGGISFGIAAIYASTCYIKRRELWSNLSSLVNQYPIPWSFIGDFNTILGAHEHRGNCAPVSTPISDFQNWTNNLNLIHLPTHGAFFTWANGRRGRQYTQRRLDRVICNQAWINVCSSVNVSTLTKNNSDHFPLLFDFSTEPSQFSSSFKFLKLWTAIKTTLILLEVVGTILSLVVQCLS
jgi:hypothetical protein